MAADALSSMATQLLDEAAIALEQPDVTTAVDALDAYEGGAPERQYVSHGEPGNEAGECECEELTVHLSALQPRALDTPSSSRCAVIPEVQFCIQLWRGVTVFENTDTPSATTLNDEALALTIDGWALWKHLTGLWKAGTLLDGISCKNVTFGTMEPLGPTGGLAGWQLCLTVEV